MNRVSALPEPLPYRDMTPELARTTREGCAALRTLSLIHI